MSIEHADRNDVHPVLHDRLHRIEQLLHLHNSAPPDNTAPAAAWRRCTQGEHRAAVTTAIVAAIALMLERPDAVPDEVVGDRDAEGDHVGEPVVHVEHAQAEREHAHVDQEARRPDEAELHELAERAVPEQTRAQAGGGLRLDLHQRRIRSPWYRSSPRRRVRSARKIATSASG